MKEIHYEPAFSRYLEIQDKNQGTYYQIPLKNSLDDHLNNLPDQACFAATPTQSE